jgi:hypothetical protein
MRSALMSTMLTAGVIIKKDAETEIEPGPDHTRSVSSSFVFFFFFFSSFVSLSFFSCLLFFHASLYQLQLWRFFCEGLPVPTDLGTPSAYFFPGDHLHPVIGLLLLQLENIPPFTSQYHYQQSLDLLCAAIIIYSINSPLSFHSTPSFVALFLPCMMACHTHLAHWEVYKIIRFLCLSFLFLKRLGNLYKIRRIPTVRASFKITAESVMSCVACRV